jgi:hypothetical protein
MARWVGRSGWRAASAFLALAGTLGFASRASAYEVKKATNGDPVHWAKGQVQFEIDPSIEANVPGGAQAVADAVNAWSGSDGAPSLSTVNATDARTPAVDGHNTITYWPGGLAGHGSALAIALVSFDENTGNIVDVDIIVNGQHPLAVLSADARAASGTAPISTEGTAQAGANATPFDFQHVLAHEIGHALGMADDQVDATDLMYAYSLPGDASVRAPTTDDLAGLTTLYDGSPTSGAKGCGGASVADARARGADGWATIAALGAAASLAATRRRARAQVVLRVRSANRSR